VDAYYPPDDRRDSEGKIDAILDRVHPSLRAEWSIWTVVNEGLATLHELETTWTLDDLQRAVDFIRVRGDIAEAAMRKHA
jgi:hypothetical protein